MNIQVLSLIQQGALFVANHSGGKDSQAQLIKMLEVIPAAQIVVVHASLGEAEWPGALEHAEQHARAVGCDFIVAKASKTIFDMVRNKKATRPEVPSFPSSSSRQCTSDLKRDPIARVIRHYAAQRGYTLIVNCLGLRAAESTSRAKRESFKLDTRNCTKGSKKAAPRLAYEWLPIHDMSTDEVFATIKAAGQELHYAYGLGNERLSCVFCIMSSNNDIACGAKHNPALAQKYIELEQEVGYTMHMSRKPLGELIALAQAA